MPSVHSCRSPWTTCSQTTWTKSLVVLFRVSSQSKVTSRLTECGVRCHIQFMASSLDHWLSHDTGVVVMEMANSGSHATRLNLLTSAEDVVAKRTSKTHECAVRETTCHSKMGEGEKASEAKSAKMGRRMGAITTQKSWPRVLNCMAAERHVDAPSCTK